MMNLDLKIPKQAERLRFASAGLPVKQLREALHPCICDGCGALLLGTRFKCIECSDFDLCAGCLRSGCPAQRASPEWSHRDTHTLVVLRRITDTAQLPRAFRLAESLQTAEEVPGGVRHAPEVPCIRGCQPRDDKSVAICTRCGSVACSGCFLCCSGAPLLRFSAKGEEALPTLLRRAKAALKHLPFEGPPVALREPHTEIQLGGPVQIGTSGRLAPPDGCEVRAMTAADMQAVLSVESICFMEPYSLETFEGLICLSSSRSLVALLEGCFAGYLILDLGRCRRRGQAAYIVSLAVLPTCRGRGVAESLMKQAISDARNSGAGSVELHVHTQNHGAQRLYRRCGFHVVCSIEGYYGEVDALQSGDAFLMSTGPLHQ